MRPTDRAAALAIELAGPGRVALGTMGLAGVYGTIDRTDARRTVFAALDAGVTLFDTAPLYGAGAAESLLGEALGGSTALIVTKFGLEARADGALARDSRPDTVRRSVEASLRRLKRDRVDALMQHRADPDIDDDIVAETLSRLVEEGKARWVGLSVSTVKRATGMRRVAPIDLVQNELSAASGIAPGRTPADFAAQGLVLMAHSPLARGVLAQVEPRVFGADDHRSSMPSLDGKGQASIIDRAERTLSGGNAPSRATSALRWVLEQGENVVAVVGARTPAQLTELLAARRHPRAPSPPTINPDIPTA